MVWCLRDSLSLELQRNVWYLAAESPCAKALKCYKWQYRYNPGEVDGSYNLMGPAFWRFAAIKRRDYFITPYYVQFDNPKWGRAFHRSEQENFQGPIEDPFEEEVFSVGPFSDVD